MAKSIYDSWRLDEMTDEQREKYEVTLSGDEGFYSMRDKFKVVCKKCGLVVHPSTTGPDSMMDMHDEDEDCAPQFERATPSEKAFCTLMSEAEGEGTPEETHWEHVVNHAFVSERAVWDRAVKWALGEQ